MTKEEIKNRISLALKAPILQQGFEIICNHYKRATRLEAWREYFLGELISRIKKIYIVKVAERYGMITFHEWDKKFYFER
jgi:hypothetical protein